MGRGWPAGGNEWSCKQRREAGEGRGKVLRHSGRPASQAAPPPGTPGTLGPGRQHLQSSATPPATPPATCRAHAHAHAGHLVQNAGLALRAGSSDPFTLNDSSFTCACPPGATERRRWSAIRGRRSRALCWPEPRPGLLCAASASRAPSLLAPGGRRAPWVEREGDREPAVRSRDGARGSQGASN